MIVGFVGLGGRREKAGGESFEGETGGRGEEKGSQCPPDEGPGHEGRQESVLMVRFSVFVSGAFVVSGRKIRSFRRWCRPRKCTRTDACSPRRWPGCTACA